MHLGQPWYVRLRYPVPYEVYCLSPPDVRTYALLRFALQADVTTLTTANPSTVLLLCRKLLEWREDLAADLAAGTLRRGPAAALDTGARALLERKLRRRDPPRDWAPARIWNLAVVNCWKGGPATWFVDRLADALGASVPIREVGITASEGFFAVPLGAEWEGGLLWTLGHLVEFRGEDGRLRWAWELREGQRMTLVVTTEGGLYRYDLDDVVEVVGRCGATPVLRFVGKGSRVLNVVGERVTEEHVALAARRATAAIPVPPAGFTVGVVPGEVPSYRIAVEGQARALARFAAVFDEALQEVNVEYRSRRATGRLGLPWAQVVSAATYARYRAARVAAGAPEGQVKDPVLAVDEAEWKAVAGP
jgi:hypothetical protein